ncbi:MAG: glutathione S-transferase [Myxococcaceae bacterium]|nr:glutathione S-transferase [Myxococcaceae bacterium]
MITLHHLNNSRSQRVLWLLEELELPYEVVRYQRDEKTMLAPRELLAIHPLGKSPVITDDGRAIAESGAIIEYLLEKYGQGRLAPSVGSEERLRFTYWLHYAEGSLMPLMVMKLVVGSIPKAPMPFFIRPVAKGISRGVDRAFLRPQSATHLNFVEGELKKSAWFAGEEFSAADIQMSFPLEAASARAGLTPLTHPKIFAWLERIHARPAYKRALSRGGVFQLASF